MFSWGKTLRPAFGEDRRPREINVMNVVAPNRRLTRAPLVVLSVSRVFSFSPAATLLRTSLFFFREFQLYGRSGKGEYTLVSTGLPSSGSSDDVPCLSPGKWFQFRSIKPTRAEGPFVFSSSSPSSSRLFPRLLTSFLFPLVQSLSRNWTFFESVLSTNVAKYLNSFRRERPTCFDVLVCFAGNGRMLKYRENWWWSTLRNAAVSSAIYHAER